MTNPVLIILTRGPLAESIHRGAVCIAGSGGEIVARLGDCDRPVFPRSAVKALQAIALVESGAADAFGLGDHELAVACASHGGEPFHVEAVRSLLAKAGVEEAALACGSHWPSNDAAARALVVAGKTPAPIHNNCSGKHAGMLALARHLKVDLAGYERPDHPVQQLIRRVMQDMTGAALGSDVCAVDGCSVPTWATPLVALARGFARFATGGDMGDLRARACARLMAACFAEPALVAGTGRFCTLAMRRLDGEAFVKTGAEGVYCAALPKTGLGVALKIDDGARRASEAVMAALLGALVSDGASRLEGAIEPQLRNWRGTVVGRIETAAELDQLLAGLRA